MTTVTFKVAKYFLITSKGNFKFDSLESLLDFDKNNWLLFEEISYKLHIDWDDGEKGSVAFKGTNANDELLGYLKKG